MKETVLAGWFPFSEEGNAYLESSRTELTGTHTTDVSDACSLLLHTLLFRGMYIDLPQSIHDYEEIEFNVFPPLSKSHSIHRCSLGKTTTSKGKFLSLVSSLLLTPLYSSKSVYITADSIKCVAEITLSAQIYLALSFGEPISIPLTLSF